MFGIVTFIIFIGLISYIGFFKAFVITLLLLILAK